MYRLSITTFHKWNYTPWWRPVVSCLVKCPLIMQDGRDAECCFWLSPQSKSGNTLIPTILTNQMFCNISITAQGFQVPFCYKQTTIHKQVVGLVYHYNEEYIWNVGVSHICHWWIKNIFFIIALLGFISMNMVNPPSHNLLIFFKNFDKLYLYDNLRSWSNTNSFTSFTYSDESLNVS